MKLPFKQKNSRYNKNTSSIKYYLSNDEIIHKEGCELIKDKPTKTIKEGSVFHNYKHPFCQKCCSATTKEKEVVRKMLLPGNGRHSSVCEMLVHIQNPSKDNKTYTCVTKDNQSFKLSFKHPCLKRVIRKNYTDKTLYIIGYPKMSQGKIRQIELIGWKYKEEYSSLDYIEKWTLTGLWTYKRDLIVQRDGVRESIALSRFQKKGILPRLFYQFKNAQDWIERKKLWIDHVYLCECERNKDELVLLKATPIACPYPKLNNKAKNNNGKKVVTTKTPPKKILKTKKKKIITFKNKEVLIT